MLLDWKAILRYGTVNQIQRGVGFHKLTTVLAVAVRASLMSSDALMSFDAASELDKA